MKKLAFLLGLCAMSVFAGQWTGYISDSNCGAKHNDGSAASIACVKGCVKKGAEPVFVTADNKVLKISDPAKVMDFLGQKVTVTGKMKGESLTVSSVKAD